MRGTRLFRKGLVLIGGLILLALGVVGAFVPVLPGVVFVIGGLLLLSTEFAWAERALARARAWIDDRRGKSETDEAHPAASE